MPDVLIRNIPADDLALLDEQARRFGLSRPRLRSVLALSTVPLLLSNTPPMLNAVLPAVPSARNWPVWLSTLPALMLRVLVLSMIPLRLFKAPRRLRSIRLAPTWRRRRRCCKSPCPRH